MGRRKKEYSKEEIIREFLYVEEMKHYPKDIKEAYFNNYYSKYILENYKDCTFVKEAISKFQYKNRYREKQ